MIKNIYGVSDIKIKATAKCFCPLGQDWYTNHFEITFVPEEYIPDYCDIDSFIKENINGKHFIIEEAVAKLYDFIKEEYQPYELQIKSEVDDAAHSAVVVNRCS